MELRLGMRANVNSRLETCDIRSVHLVPTNALAEQPRFVACEV